MKRCSYNFATLTVFLALAACSEETPPAVEALPPPDQMADRETIKDAVESKPVEETEEMAAEPVILPQPGDLLGLRPQDVFARLGVPDFVRWDDPAQTYQYRNDVCVFDIVFYEDNPGDAFLARHIEARDFFGDAYPMQECLVAILPDGNWPDPLLEP